MSVQTPTNVHGAVASALANPTILSEEEQIFQEAFQKAKHERTQLGQVPAFFNGLQAAKNSDEVLQILQRERQCNFIWKEQKGRKWIKALSQLAGVIMTLKPMVDNVVQIGSTVAAPIWGGIAFIFGVIKDLSTTNETLDQVCEELEDSIERFREYYQVNQAPRRVLHNALLKYYKRIIIFVVDLQAEFIYNKAASLWRAVTGSFKETVDSFNKSLTLLIPKVDWGANASAHIQIREQNVQLARMVGNIPMQIATLVPVIPTTGTSKSFQFGIPGMLSHTFTGRTDVLQRLRDTHKSRQGLTRSVIHGIGGIGKTQILLKYADQYSLTTAHQQAYTSIIFFDATTVDDILHVITLLAYHLRPTAPPQYQKNLIIADFHKWLRTQEDWLLIFDNVRNLDTIRDFLPPTTDLGHIVFSTRDLGLANSLAQNARPIEILQMDELNATQLAQSLAQDSLFAADKTAETAGQIAQFAQGLPLVIEQVVHSAIFKSRSISDTLSLVKSKKENLLKQDNESSLRGPKSSIGAVVMQSMEDLRSQDREAEALFRIMAYWSASSIPLRMIQDGAGKLPDYLQRHYTFDRGQITFANNRGLVDHIDVGAKPEKFRLFDEDPFHADTWLKLFHLKERQSEYKDTELPLDDTKLDAVIRSACREDAPMGRLFKNEHTVRNAANMVKNAGLVRDSHVGVLWMHDLFSEVARAIIEHDEQPKTSALVATTLVYLAFPVPTRRSRRDRENLCHQYLPHALACHQHLQSLRILNNLSLGPELSHIIASTFCMRTPPSYTNLSTSAGLGSLEAMRTYRRQRNDKAISYYKAALKGYRESQKRVESFAGVTPKRIIFATIADRFPEEKYKYTYDDYVDDLQRFGRNPHWRTIQTALRLSSLLADGGYEDIEESIPITALALKMQEHFLGDNNDDAITTRKFLFNRLYDTGNFEEAYKVAFLGLQKLLGWSEERQAYRGGKDRPKAFSASIDAVFFCRGAGICCLELPGMIKKSFAYLKVYLRYCQNIRGEEHYSSIEPMQKLAIAYEKCDEKLPSIYWLGCSVQCALRSLEIEGHDIGEDELRERTIWRGNLVKSESVMENAVTCYEQARERFGAFSEHSLCKFLEVVDSRIEIWRKDRQIWGSPYEKENMGTQPVFPPGENEEEFEARIQRDADEWIRTQEWEENKVAEAEDIPRDLSEPCGIVPKMCAI